MSSHKYQSNCVDVLNWCPLVGAFKKVCNWSERKKEMFLQKRKFRREGGRHNAHVLTDGSTSLDQTPFGRVTFGRWAVLNQTYRQTDCLTINTKHCIGKMSFGKMLFY
jgi:hypothetical protein